MKRFFSLLLVLSLLFVTYTPYVHAAQTVTMYASDGRSISVNPDDIQLWKNVGWYESAEDAKIITVYSLDGRTLDIPQYYRKAYNDVGWYNTKEDVSCTMYSLDGRSIEVYKAFCEEFRAVGWYYNLSDVTVKMYDADGNEYTVFKDHIKSEEEKGLTTDRNKVMQLMFSSDGRFIYVPHKDVDAYNKVGWYTGGRTEVDPTRPMVAVTFDDGPGKYTDRILSILEKYNARATFFVQGQYVSRYKDVVKRAVSLGNEIGNHTWSHVNLTSTIGNQIASTNTAVYNVTGIYPKVYRPPYGSYNSHVLNSISMPAIMWSVDTLDWKTRNAAKTLASVKKDTRDGGIILMHDIHEPTADAVEPVVKHLLMQGYQLVTVSELLDARCGGGKSGKAYNSAPTA